MKFPEDANTKVFVFKGLSVLSLFFWLVTDCALVAFISVSP